MFCPSCGKRPPHDATFCPWCGKALPENVAAGHKPSQQPHQQQAAATEAQHASAPETAQAFAGHAGFWKRFLAWCIDYPLAMILVAVISFVEGFVLELLDVSGERIADLAFALGIALPWLYFALFQSSAWQATPGKLALGVKVTDMNGERIRFLRATGRYFGKYLSALLLLFGFIMAGFTPQKQALHDLMARTLVVNARR